MSRATRRCRAQLSRFWLVTMAYNRSVGRLGGQVLPYVTDSVSGAVSGLMTRRLGLSVAGGYSRGTSVGGAENAYDSPYASARVSYTLTRDLPVWVEYVYYRYGFNQATGLAPGFPLVMNRQGLHAGL